MKPNTCDILIVGAGPAGLMAAIAAAQQGSHVIVCERHDKPGRKLLASGGGRCNLTNTISRLEFARAFGREKATLVLSCIKQFGQRDVIKFFETAGVPLKAEDAIHYYPASNRSVDVLAALLKVARSHGADIRTGFDVRRIQLERDMIRAEVTPSEIWEARACILAAGGCGYPQLGGTESGFDLARNLGYSITTPTPGLVGLIAHEQWPGMCAGLTLDWARLRVIQTDGTRHHSDGSLLFTHRGISGPSALNLSSVITRELRRGSPIFVKCIIQKETDSAVWNERFSLWQQTHGGRPLGSCLCAYLPRRMVEVVLHLCGCPTETRCSDVNKQMKTGLIEVLTQGLPLHIGQSEGWERSMVTSGGVAIDQVDSHTMRGRRHDHLYFAGEVVDCDGPCGGYNLTWALSSGWVAGVNAASGTESP